jgi:hypothetical protein
MKHLEKIIFVIGLGLAAGLYFFLTGASQPAAVSPITISQSRGGPVTALDIPQVIDLEVVWDSPRPQSEDGLWLYDVFTPPRIFINPETGQMEPTPFAPPPPPPAFGLRLTAMNRDMFRLQLDGYIEQDLGDASTSILLFLDTENQNILRGRVGDALAEMDIRVDAFEVERRINEEDSTIIRIPRVTVTDLRNGESLSMTTGERIFGREIEIRFSHNDVSGQTFTAAAVGDVITVGDERFELIDINLTGQTVRVRKTSPLLAEPEEVTLSVQTGTSPRARRTEEAPAQPAETSSDFFDFPF